MSPQCEDGFTKIANELLEALCLIRIPGESMQIFLVILRKTYGYGKKCDRIALSQFVEATGIAKTHVARSIDKLESMNLIVTQKGNFKGASYEINKHYDTWQALPKKVILPKLVTLPKMVTEVTQNGNDITQNGNKSYPKRVPQKKERNLSKETTKEKEPCEFLFPDWLPFDSWESYLKMRKKMKKPIDPENYRLAVDKLGKLKEAGFLPKDVLEQSIFNNWQGLFEIKGASNGNGNAGTFGRAAQTGRKTGIIEANGAGTDFLG